MSIESRLAPAIALILSQVACAEPPVEITDELDRVAHEVRSSTETSDEQLGHLQGTINYVNTRIGLETKSEEIPALLKELDSARKLAAKLEESVGSDPSAVSGSPSYKLFVLKQQLSALQEKVERHYDPALLKALEDLGARRYITFAPLDTMGLYDPSSNRERLQGIGSSVDSSEEFTRFMKELDNAFVYTANFYTYYSMALVNNHRFGAEDAYRGAVAFQDATVSLIGTVDQELLFNSPYFPHLNMNDQEALKTAFMGELSADSENPYIQEMFSMTMPPKDEE